MIKELELLEKLKLFLMDKGDAIFLPSDYDLLLKTPTPPTAEEVCKALSEIEGLAVRYEAKEQAFINEHEQTLIVMMDSGLLLRLYDTYPASVITLIGRFYQGVEHERD